MGAAQPIKGKSDVDLYSAFILTHPIDGQVWIAQFYLQITPYLPLPRKRSPDGATADCSGRHDLVAAYYSFIDPKGWNAELA